MPSRRGSRRVPILIEIGGNPFKGYIDVIGERDGGIYIIDRKSHRLKSRNNRCVPTESDKELDSYLRQLYLYGEYIKCRFGAPPRGLPSRSRDTAAFLDKTKRPRTHLIRPSAYKSVT